jgi:hypothetical protein
MKTGPSIIKRFVAEQRLLVWWLLVSLAAHMAAGAVFRVGTFARALKAPVQPLVQYVGTADEVTLGLAAVRDPSLTALASPHGFSAPAFSPPRLSYQPPSVSQPARLLAAPPPVMTAGPQAVEMPAAKFAPSSQESNEAQVAPATATQVSFGPSLAARAPRLAPESLRLEGPAPQQATVLRVAVDAIGVVRHALLAESSGSAAADNRGLQQVQSWRFLSEDRPSDALAWGEVRILWIGGETAAPAAGGVR